MKQLTVREIKGLSPSDLMARFTEAVTDQASRKGHGVRPSNSLNLYAGRLAAEIVGRMEGKEQ